ncbi:MAG: hypothetical protein CMP11_05435 [Zetaproteobacteria bacterium]|nr:hypothetical protein [Pseudobdellovibrionaceae bacterium]|tara:strand:- start:1104 stop:1307 length:204 start_codon:yes stop_codon:yes gene_type:complete
MNTLKKFILLLAALTSSFVFAHNMGEHSGGDLNLWHYLTEWHHGGPFWILGAFFILSCLFYLNKSRS